MFTTPSRRWTALVNRDPTASNAFIYSVITTKIYCRPNCPSRLARRANIVFHNTAEEAEKGGYRACMRCKPSMDGCDPQKVAVDAACVLLNEERSHRVEGVAGDKWSVRALAKEVGLTESHFCRIFKKIMGKTIGDYRSQLQSTSQASSVGAGPVTLAQITSMGAPSAVEATPHIVGRSDSSTFAFDMVNDWNTFSVGPYPESEYELLSEMDVAESSTTIGFLGLPWLKDISDPSTPSICDGMEFVDFGSYPGGEYLQ